MVKAIVTNNGSTMETVKTDLTDELSQTFIPPKSRGKVVFVDKNSFEAALKKASKENTKISIMEDK